MRNSKSDKITLFINNVCESCNQCERCHLTDLSGLERAADCNRALDVLLEWRRMEPETWAKMQPAPAAQKPYLLTSKTVSNGK